MLACGPERLLKVLLAAVAVGLAAFAAVLFAIPSLPAGARPWDNDAAAIRALLQLAASPQRAAALFDDDAATAADGLPIAHRRGFCFRAFLRRADGSWRPASPRDLGAAITAWRCYAWPALANVSGKRTLVVDDRGAVSWRYARGAYGGERAPAATAALPDPVAAPRVDAHRGRDGGLWQHLR